MQRLCEYCLGVKSGIILEKEYLQLKKKDLPMFNLHSIVAHSCGKHANITQFIDIDIAYAKSHP